MNLNMKTLCEQIVIAEKKGQVDRLMDLFIQGLVKCRWHSPGDFLSEEAPDMIAEHLHNYYQFVINDKELMTEVENWRLGD